MRCARLKPPRAKTTGRWLGDAFRRALIDRLGSSCLDGFLATGQSSQSRHVADDHHVAVKERNVLAGEPSQNAIDRLAGEPEVITDLQLRKVEVECRPRDQSASAQSLRGGTGAGIQFAAGAARSLRSVRGQSSIYLPR